MISENDIDYCLVREAEERLASKNASSDTARIAHAELADRYAERAWAAREALINSGLEQKVGVSDLIA
jgi:hypothetical protein